MNTAIFTDKASMTSVEIAELVGSRHDKVKQSIERLAERGIIQLPPMGISENINGLGLTQKSKHYLFEGERGKRDSIIVVAQLCPEFTAPPGRPLARTGRTNPQTNEPDRNGCCNGA